MGTGEVGYVNLAWHAGLNGSRWSRVAGILGFLGCDTHLYPTNEPHKVFIHLTTSVSITGSEALFLKLGEPREWVAVGTWSNKAHGSGGVGWGVYTLVIQTPGLWFAQSPASESVLNMNGFNRQKYSQISLDHLQLGFQQAWWRWSRSEGSFSPTPPWATSLHSSHTSF